MKDWEYKPAGDFGLDPAQGLRSVRRESGLIASITQASWQVAVRLYLRGYHRLTIRGTENLPPEPPFVLIANHGSHLDALVLAATLPPRLRRVAFPIAAGDVFFETPVASIFAAMMLNALPMWRKRCGSHAMLDLRVRLTGDPAIYILFPEGTRSRDGRIGAFKPGIGMIVAESDVPVVPCYLRGTHAALPPGRRWPGPARISVSIGSPLTFSAATNDRTGWLKISDQLATAVRTLAGEQPSAEPGS